MSIFCNVSLELDKLFLEIKNKGVPNIDHCGTPDVIVKVSEIESL